MSIYTDNGFRNRNEYLQSLAEEYGVDRSTVDSLADLLGESEDFDGLISGLQDIETTDDCSYSVPLQTLASAPFYEVELPTIRDLQYLAEQARQYQPL